MLLVTFLVAQAARHIIALNPAQPKDGVMLPAVLWNDTTCLSLMPDEAKDKFKHIAYGPYKSDLCRLFVMYKYGGLYTDSDVWMHKAPPDNLLIRESARFKTQQGTAFIMNAVMRSRARNPYFKRAIEVMLQTHEGAHPGLWGPWALQVANPRNFTIIDEECPTASPCSCGVPGLFISHRPCRY